jgi:phosphate uptake regulator
MRRRIVQQGPATLMISLPAKWVKKQGLKKGDEVDIELEESTLLVRTERKPQLQKTSINLSDYGSIASRAIGALYKQGYDQIEILFSSPKDMNIVNKNLKEFVGFEIIKQTTKACTIREISVAKEDEFDIILNRTMLLLKSVADDCYNSLKSKDMNLLKTIPARDQTINKYANYCRRILNKYGHKQYKKTPTLYYILEELESLGDEYKHLADFIIEHKIRLDKAALDLLSSVNSLLDKLYRLILKFDTKKAAALHSEYTTLNSKIHRLDKTREANKARLYNSLSSMSRIIHNMLGPLMTANLD